VNVDLTRSNASAQFSKLAILNPSIWRRWHYTQASATLARYLDYPDPVAKARRGIMLEVYPAINALCTLRKPVVPELMAAIADAETPELARENAAFTSAYLRGERARRRHGLVNS
jgi:hypothetical protein